jgi:hypothetical protein
MARERKFLNSLDQHVQSEDDEKRKPSDVLMTLYLPVECTVMWIQQDQFPAVFRPLLSL